MFAAYVMVPILYIRIRLMVTNDPKAMSFLLMNALVCVVMLDISIIVNICAARTVSRVYAVWWLVDDIINKGLT